MRPKQHNSPSLTNRLRFLNGHMVLAIFLVCSSGQAAGEISCGKIFRSLSEEKQFDVESGNTDLVRSFVPTFTLVSKQVEILSRSLTVVTRSSRITPWVTKFHLTAGVPKKTANRQWLGYQLMKGNFQSANLKMDRHGTVTVSAIQTSVQEIADQIVLRTRNVDLNSQDRDAIFSQVSALADSVGATDQRLILQSTYREPQTLYVSFSGTGMTVHSFAIINVQSGVTAQITFFTSAD